MAGERRRGRFTLKEDRELIAMAASGATSSEIAAKFGTSAETIEGKDQGIRNSAQGEPGRARAEGEREIAASEFRFISLSPANKRTLCHGAPWTRRPGMSGHIINSKGDLVGVVLLRDNLGSLAVFPAFALD